MARQKQNTVITYLHVKGADKLITFMKSALGGKLNVRHLAPDGSIMHAQVMLDNTLIMVSDLCKSHTPTTAMFYMYVPNCDATYKKALKAGAKSTMKPADMFYGDRAGAVDDIWENKWWFATHKKDVSAAETKKAIAAMSKKKK